MNYTSVRDIYIDQIIHGLSQVLNDPPRKLSAGNEAFYLVPAAQFQIIKDYFIRIEGYIKRVDNCINPDGAPTTQHHRDELRRLTRQQLEQELVYMGKVLELFAGQ